MDEGAISKPLAIKEFPPLTKEDLVEIHNLDIALCGKFPEEIPGFELFIGANQNVGQGNVIINSYMTLRQLHYTLAMTRHPLVKELVKPNFEVSNFNTRSLVESKIMAGMKILDLGCGPLPVFARCCRAMGADVWTVDKISSKYFYSGDDSIPKGVKDLEAERHIQVDLSNYLAASLIKERSAGDFNLGTESQLRADWFYEGREVAWGLLRKGGIYHAVGRDPELKE